MVLRSNAFSSCHNSPGHPSPTLCLFTSLPFSFRILSCPKESATKLIKVVGESQKNRSQRAWRNDALKVFLAARTASMKLILLWIAIATLTTKWHIMGSHILFRNKAARLGDSCIKSVLRVGQRSYEGHTVHLKPACCDGFHGWSFPLQCLSILQPLRVVRGPTMGIAPHPEHWLPGCCLRSTFEWANFQ